MKCRYFLSILLLCFSYHANADIGVSPMIIDITGKAGSEIAVKNFDSHNNAYVEIIPYRLFNPANHSEPKRRIHDPEKDGLVVFPSKLVLLPGQTQFVRIIKTAQSLKSDQVYEVDFIPKVSTQLINQENAGVTLGIRVIVGYGARVTLRPDILSPLIDIKRIGNEFSIKNTGNTLLTITSCTQTIQGKKIEIPLPAYTLYVGQTIKTKLSQSTQVTLNVSCMGKSLNPLQAD